MVVVVGVRVECYHYHFDIVLVTYTASIRHWDWTAMWDGTIVHVDWEPVVEVVIVEDDVWTIDCQTMSVQIAVVAWREVSFVLHGIHPDHVHVHVQYCGE